MISSMFLLLTTYRTRDDFTIDELVSTTADLIRQTALTQARYKVTQTPDIRTVRYYSATGLLPKPLGSRGSAALFGYRHLLTLLAIKILQARFLPLQQVREVLAPLDEKGLEKLIQQGIPDEPVDTLVRRESAAANLERPRSRGAKASTTPRARRPELTPFEPALPLSGMGAPGPDASTWERLEVEPGLELQVRADYGGAKSISGVSAVLSKIRVLLEARQGREALSDAAKDGSKPDRGA